jgi:glycosyltransferase 2 family protein
VLFQKVKPYLSAAVTLLLLYFLVRYVKENWTQMRQVPWHFQIGWMAAAFVCQFLFWLFMARNWVVFLRWGGTDVSHRSGWWAWSRASLARYIPTPIWAMGSRIVLANQLGAPLGLSTWSYWVELGMALAATSIVALLALPLWFTGISIGGMAVVAGISGLLLLPLALHFILFPLLRRWGLKLNANFFQLWVWSTLVLLAALLYGISHVFVLVGSGVQVVNPGELAGVGALSWVAGTVNIFSPGGLGTREAVLVAGLQGILDPSAVVQLSVVMRLLTTAAELAFLGMNFLLSFSKPRHPAESS